MRLLGFFAALLALSCSGQSAAQEPSGSAAPQPDPRNLALANEIIDLSYPPPMRQAMMLRSAETMMAQAHAATLAAAGPNLDPEIQEILERHLERVRVQAGPLVAEASPAIFSAFARAYARRFTRDELVQIRAFVATPAGSRYVQQSVDLLSDPDIVQANTAYMTSVFRAIQPLQAEMIQELAEYVRRREGQREPATESRRR
ncbi:MAG: DUF2059 domain-containing protein [Pseudomonadota bacterium]|nr:DUF2059 domain-containing protein [Pseudomonadota bacterium]